MIHEPSDSWLLCDAMRIMVRLLDASRRSAARCRPLPGIITAGGPSGVPSHRSLPQADQADRMLYRDLIAVAGSTVGYLRAASARVSAAACAGIEVEAWLASSRALGSPWSSRLSSRPSGCVLKGETVPAAEKLVSLFEPHSDIIAKGGRDVHYGHKLNLTSGKSGMILDVVIEAGNPADAERLLPMLERHIDIYGRPPRQMACRRRLCQRRQPQGRQGKGRQGHGVPQEARAEDRRHGQEPLGLSQAAQLPRRHRGRHLVPEAGLWLGALHLEGPGPLQGPPSGPRWWPTTWRSSHASSRHSPAHNRARLQDRAAPGA